MSGLFGAFISRADAAALVVTAFDGAERSGCLIGFASQCSIEPPRLVVWLSTVNHTYRIASATDLLGVHLIPTEAVAVAELFAEESGDWTDKFARCRWSEGPDGVPLLEECPDRVVGRVVQRVDVGGDHVGFVLEPLEVTLGETSTEPSARWLHLGAVSSMRPGHPVD